ncbi:hypothetical protein [Lentzea terrae]|uniref:hypothetical protein n=1 Tax=Lentzea terrae TaxID=2200761 RepID=UPI000DD3AF43|nr:hypothetical protein [Lentzea terrae]
MGIALAAYREAIKHPVNGGFDVLLRSLLTDLRHLAVAYKIRLESTPEPGQNMPPMAWDLVEVYDEIRNAARGSWAKALAATGRTAADVEQDAFRDFHRDCVTT